MAPNITFNKQDEEEDDESSDDNLEDEAATGKKREGSSRIENKFSAAATVAVMAGNCFLFHWFLSPQQARCRLKNASKW